MSWPYRYDSGVTYCDENSASKGYTLIALTSHIHASEPDVKYGEVLLIDLKGDTVHRWITPYPVFYARLLPNGHLVAALRRIQGNSKRESFGRGKSGGGTGLLMELDWEGNCIFQYFDPMMHHDFQKLPGGNYLYIGSEEIPPEIVKKVRGGQKGTEHDDGAMYGDYLREIDAEAKTVWEWRSIKHLDPDIDIIGPIYSRKEWTHLNAVDVMPDGNIMVDGRYTDSAFIIDRKTGDIVWRWGNVAYLDGETGLIEYRDTKAPCILGGPHAAHIIPEGYPGSGNMLIYDNGLYSYRSRAVEVDIESGEVVWQSEKNRGFVEGRIHFSPFISNAERLPNGNTLICAGGNGVITEITSEKQLVWQWVRPAPNSEGSLLWGVFKAHRYTPDYCPQFGSLPGPDGE